MKPAGGGYRVAVIGASSFLGKELLAVIKERQFVISRLVTPDVLDDPDPDLPVLDLGESPEARIVEEDVPESELDFVFLAAPLPPEPKKKSEEEVQEPFLRSAKRLSASKNCRVIDLNGAAGDEAGGFLCAPFIEPNATPAAAEAGGASAFFIAANPAAMMLAGLLLRLAGRFRLTSAVAQIFAPVSEMGARAIEELQRQTSGLLSFQKIPQAIFGGQLAFNLLPRFGSRGGTLEDENRIRKHLKGLLGDRLPLPALRILRVPVFHSLACSLYVELAQRETPEALAQALAGGPIRMRKASERPPSPVEAAGENEIFVDVLTPDAGRPGGLWIWAVADNLRISALNAVQIAEKTLLRNPTSIH